MGKVVIGFSYAKNRNPITLLFMWFMKAPFSHCYIRLGDMVYHSSHLYVHSLLYENFKQKSEIVEEIQLTLMDDYEVKNVEDICKRYLSASYSIIGLLGILFARIFNRKKNPFRDGAKGMICSEFVARVLQEVGYVFDKDLELVTPLDIYQKLKGGLC